MLSNQSIKEIVQARWINLLAFLVCVLLFFSGCSFDNDTGNNETIASERVQRARVIKIKDGDSVVLRFENSKEKEARLFGIDAPEYSQAFGQESKAILKKMAYKKTVIVKSLGSDRYQRDIVILFLDNQTKSINQRMLELGAAWVYIQYQNDQTWIDSQKQARQKSLGLWKNNAALAPWKWRKRQDAKKK